MGVLQLLYTGYLLGMAEKALQRFCESFATNLTLFVWNPTHIDRKCIVLQQVGCLRV